MMHLLSDETRRNPYPLYEQMRSQSPLLRLSSPELWMVFDHDGVKRVLHDHESFSSSATPPTGRAPDWLVFSDPPRHTKLRALIMRAFTQRSIAALEPSARVAAPA